MIEFIDFLKSFESKFIKIEIPAKNKPKQAAQMSKNKKSGNRQALLTEVTAFLADVMGKPKKKGKNVQIAEEEANFGESLITEVSALLTSAISTTLL